MPIVVLNLQVYTEIYPRF